MKTSEFLDQLTQALNIPPGTLKLDDTPETLPEWDSLGNLTIVGLLDSLFDLTTSAISTQPFASIGELVESLKKGGFLEDDAQ